jgi:hypothetical protein
MGSRPAANPRYLKSGQLASYFWVVCFLLLIEFFWGAGFRGWRTSCSYDMPRSAWYVYYVVQILVCANTWHTISDSNSCKCRSFRHMAFWGISNRRYLEAVSHWVAALSQAINLILWAQKRPIKPYLLLPHVMTRHGVLNGSELHVPFLLKLLHF